MKAYNWVLTLYGNNNTIRKRFLIMNRTERAANNEAMRYIENFRITLDWTLTLASKKDLTISELN